MKSIKNFLFTTLLTTWTNILILFPIILLILFFVIITTTIIMIIILISSVDLTNVPYFYTNQEISYNVPVVESNYIKEYWKAQNLSLFMKHFKNLKIDLMSNLYFYSKNAQFLQNLRFPARFFWVWETTFFNGTAYSKNRWNDFEYIFQKEIELNWTKN